MVCSRLCPGIVVISTFTFTIQLTMECKGKKQRNYSLSDEGIEVCLGKD